MSNEDSIDFSSAGSELTDETSSNSDTQSIKYKSDKIGKKKRMSTVRIKIFFPINKIIFLFYLKEPVPVEPKRTIFSNYVIPPSQEIISLSLIDRASTSSLLSTKTTKFTG
jgi:hypothetical protein